MCFGENIHDLEKIFIMGKSSLFLSRKSIWRKTNSYVARNDTYIIPSLTNNNNNNNNNNNEINGLLTQLIEYELGDVHIIPRLKSALSLSTMTEQERLLRPKDTRILRFSSTVHVCLIPSRIDLKPNLIDLYWKSEDYIQFKQEAVYELRAALTLHKITAKEAIDLLYQPKEKDRLSYDNISQSPHQSPQTGLIRKNSLSGVIMTSVPFITGIKTDVRIFQIILYSL
jgi:hypothetical protein